MDTPPIWIDEEPVRSQPAQPVTAKVRVHLSPCKACLREISWEAPRCPGCGHLNPSLDAEGNVSGFTVLAIIVGGIGLFYFVPLLGNEMTHAIGVMGISITIASCMNLFAVGGVITLLRSIRNRL